MNRILMAIMAVVVAVAFSAPAFAGSKKEKKEEGGKLIETTYGAEKEKKEKKEGNVDTYGKKKEKKEGDN